MKNEDFDNRNDDFDNEIYVTSCEENASNAVRERKSAGKVPLAAKKYFAVAAASCLLILAIVAVAFSLGGCADNQNQANLGGVVQENGDGMGGYDGNHEYSYAYAHKIESLDGSVIDYLYEKIGPDFQKYLDELDAEGKRLGYKRGSPDLRPWLVRVIEDYKVPREDFEKINQRNIESDKKEPLPFDWTFTDKEIDALYSNDPAVITKAFATKYAIIVDGKACAPEFYLNATQEELAHYGISAAEVKEKTELLLKDSIIEEKDIK